MEKYIVKLTNEERVDLISLISKGKASAKKLTHARILLAIDGSNNGIQTDASVAEPLHISERTVRRVRTECVENGIGSALERKLHTAARPKKIQGAEEARLLALCCSNAPNGRTRWTLKLLADKLGAVDNHFIKSSKLNRKLVLWPPENNRPACNTV